MLLTLLLSDASIFHHFGAALRATCGSGAPILLSPRADCCTCYIFSFIFLSARYSPRADLHGSTCGLFRMCSFCCVHVRTIVLLRVTCDSLTPFFLQSTCGLLHAWLISLLLFFFVVYRHLSLCSRAYNYLPLFTHMCPLTYECS